MKKFAALLILSLCNYTMANPIVDCEISVDNLEFRDDGMVTTAPGVNVLKTMRLELARNPHFLGNFTAWPEFRFKLDRFEKLVETRTMIEEVSDDYAGDYYSLLASVSIWKDSDVIENKASLLSIITRNPNIESEDRRRVYSVTEVDLQSLDQKVGITNHLDTTQIHPDVLMGGVRFACVEVMPSPDSN